ncbi:MAG: hypothetical protein IJ250_02730 [Bacteroidales bacterium]|nr:hypothetical protein [Bacteroidales bacterium]
MKELLEYSCYDERICDCNCPNMDCIHNKIYFTEVTNHERIDNHSEHQLPGDNSGD